MATNMAPSKWQEIKGNLSVKAVRNVRRGSQVEEGIGIFRQGVKLDIERSRLLTESYQATEGEPMVIRRAKALEHILLNMTIYIREWERVVGNYASSPEATFWAIEQNWKSVHRLVHGEGKYLLDDADRAELDALVEYWNGNSLSDVRKKVFAGSPDLKRYWEYEGTFFQSHGADFGNLNFEKVLKVGLNGIIKEVEAKLEEIGKTLPPDYMDQKDFLEAAAITLKAAVKWAKRFADLARELAKSEKDAERKKQLEEIAQSCAWVPANPARTLPEALQSFLFIFMINQQIELETLSCAVRFDQIMGPFYKRDLEEARITREEAMDVLSSFWLMFEELGQMYSPLFTMVYGGVQSLLSFTMGGMDSNGKDVTNEFTYLVLDVVRELRTIQPSIALRIHAGTPKELLLKAIDVMRIGLGFPALFNDGSLIPLLMKWGCPIEDARNYSVSGCVYLHIPGKNQVKYQGSGGYFSLPKCLWWALRQGVDPRTGEQYGARTPDPATFTSVHDVMQAYLEQVRFFHGKAVQLDNHTKPIYERLLPRPFNSALVDGSIERGQDIRKWIYPSQVVNMTVIVGPTNVVDSLVAIKKLVSDEQRVSMTELIEALDRNWEGLEDLRQMCLSAPKFGNDDDYVDVLAREVHYQTEKVIEEAVNRWGLHGRGDGSGVSATYGLSLECPATPDGRKNGDYFADSTLAPQPGADHKGPTAVLESAAKIDVLQTYNHLLNQRFSPRFLEGDMKEMFYSYLNSWYDLGIPHVQFNVLDKATLLDAQEHPEKHTGLIVRVAGYSAYFVDLSKGLQDHIIARTEQNFT